MSELRTNRIVPRDGLPSGASGGIIQMVQTIKTDTFATTSTSFVDVGLSASITPTSSSNKVLVRAVVCAGNGQSGSDNKIRVLRGSTVITTNNVFVRNASISETETYVIEILDSKKHYISDYIQGARQRRNQ